MLWRGGGGSGKASKGRFKLKNRFVSLSLGLNILIPPSLFIESPPRVLLYGNYLFNLSEKQYSH